MSDEPKRVAVIVGGKFGTVDESDLPKMPKGTRVLSKAEAEEREAADARAEAEARDQARYDKLPTGVKVAGALQDAVGAIVPGGGGLAIGSAHGSLPVAKAYGEGVTQGATAGLGQGIARQALDATMGPDAGARYAQQADDSRLAHPLAHGAGEIVGTAAGLVAPIGNAAEHVAGQALTRAGIEGTSALGRAGVAATKLGARGIAEGAVIGAGEEAGDELLHDHELAADKIVSHGLTGGIYGGLIGAGLGGAGSLIGSGWRAGASRLLSREATDVAAREGTEAATTAVPSQGKIASMLDNPTAGGKRMANELAFDALGATKVQMRDALEHVASDPAAAKAAVGGYVNELIARNVGKDASAWTVGKVGRADDLLEMIQADKSGRVAAGLSDAVKGTPARVDMRGIYEAADRIGSDMMRDPTKIAGAETFKNRVLLEAQAIANAGKVAADGTIDASDAFYLRSQLAKQAYEVGRASGAAGDAYKAFLRDFDAQTIKAIDDAGAAAGKSGVGDNIRYWKREWQLASAAEKAAQGGAERIAGNNFFGLREGIGLAAGLATGHAVVPLAGALAFKVAKERGKAVLAHTLYQAAERGTLARLVERTDTQIERASKGLIALPEKGATKASEVMPPPRQLISKTLARAAAFQADPESFIDKATQDTDGIRAHSPEIADAMVQRQVRGELLIASKIPYQGEPDPLDPHPRARLTPSEEASVARTAWYVDKPGRFFAEVARGKLVPEGAEVAQVMMPGAFADLQAATQDALTTQLARGNRLPFRQRELLGQLLDFAATPSQRPEHRTFLQQNVSDVLPSNERIPSAGPKGPRRPMMSQNGSALDRLEGKGPGRR